jgi:UDP-N-acetyl-D-glucosamine/UDP-N-acetyl-D-galactosamine dehydrogenase
LAGRRINDNMGIFIANKVVKLMSKNKLSIHGGRVLVLGITFKENCPDIRNSRVIDVIRELEGFGLQVDTYDPEANAEEVSHEYQLDLVAAPTGRYDAVVMAVSHEAFKQLTWGSFTHEQSVVYDVKSTLDKSLITSRL